MESKKEHTEMRGTETQKPGMQLNLICPRSLSSSRGNNGDPN